MNDEPNRSGPTRREFLRTGAAVGGAVLAGAIPAGAIPALAADATRTWGLHGPQGRARVAPMRILILGGTGFIGPHLVRHAVSRGHSVTIFTRGRRDGDLPSGVERLVGDRMINDTIPQGNLKALEGRKWDAVIDDSATDPRWVRQSTSLLKDSGFYMFVSSTGVYLPYKVKDADESVPVVLDPPNSAEYGVRKAQSERVVADVFGDRGNTVRPSYIVGPGDTTDRFPYWPQRLERGGETLAPGRKTDQSQLVDVRDLVEFMVKLVEERRGGTFNVAGPKERLTFESFLTQAKAALNSSSEFVWIEDYEFLRANRVGQVVPWTRLDGDNLYHTVIGNGKAIAAGLTFRPLAQTVRDTLAWWKTEPEARRTGARFQLTAQRETELLAAWKARGEHLFRDS